MLEFYLLSLFPQAFESYLSSSIIARALSEGFISINLVNIRDYSVDLHKKVDDSVFSGGSGMLLTCQPVYDAVTSIENWENSEIIFLGPSGRSYKQKEAFFFSKKKKIILISGHYEGFDVRLFKIFKQHHHFSIGDFILTNGILPSLCILDSVSRVLFMQREKRKDLGLNEESFSLNGGLLEYSQYTKPRDFRGISVPAVLYEGNDKKIKAWKMKSSFLNTLKNRPELFYEKTFSMQQLEILVNCFEGDQ